MAQEHFLDALEPEIQRQILLEAETPNDIHSLIQASPRLYQVFSLSRGYILSTVARRQFHPAVVPDALIFTKASQLKQPVSREAALQICHFSSSKLLKWPDTVSSVSESAALCRLARNVGFFIQDYAKQTLPIMQQIGRIQGLNCECDYDLDYWVEHSAESVVLSESEQGRIQRAFCRFEIFRYIFARCSTYIDHKVRVCASQPSLNPTEQASLYLGKFPDFQITEINCIRDYLSCRLRGIFFQLEEEAVETLSPETFMFDLEGDVEGAELASGVYPFTESGKSRQNEHFEHLMFLGLPYIRQILEATGDQKRCLFIRHCPGAVVRHLEKNFIAEAIERLGITPASEGVSFAPVSRPSSEDPKYTSAELGIPDAWQWAHPQGPPLTFFDIIRKGLRDWGYVFWDRERLDESGILKHEVLDVRRIRFNEGLTSSGPSVAKRLLDEFNSKETYGCMVRMLAEG